MYGINFSTPKPTYLYVQLGVIVNFRIWQSCKDKSIADVDRYETMYWWYATNYPLLEAQAQLAKHDTITSKVKSRLKVKWRLLLPKRVLKRQSTWIVVFCNLCLRKFNSLFSGKFVERAYATNNTFVFCILVQYRT